MKYTETIPSDTVCDLVLNYWVFEIPKSTKNGKAFVHEMMPENTVSIVFINQPHFKGIRILGPQTTRFNQQIYPGSTYLGIRLNPWLKIDSIISDKKTIINQTAAAPNSFKEIFREVNIQSLNKVLTNHHLIENGLLRLIKKEKINTDLLVKYICIQLKGEKKINEIIKDIPLSIRPIQKTFKSITGMTMTKFRSIHRVQNTIKMIHLESDNISQAAVKNNYTDHSHFSKTFKKYMENTSIKNFLQKADQIELSIKN